MPDSPPITNIDTKPMAKSIGVRELDAAAPQRAEPVERLDGGGHPDDHRGQHEAHAEHRVHAALEHVVPPHDPGQERDADDRERHRVVAEDRLAREGGEDVRRDAHGGQDQDVDLGVTEEPEQVLPEQRFAAAGRQEEVRAGHAVEEQHAEGRGEDRQRQQQQDGGDEQRPDGERQPEPGHARRPHVDDRGDVVDRAHQRRDAEHDQADAPEVLAPVDAGVGRHRAERRIRGPARGGGAARRRRSSPA